MAKKWTLLEFESNQKLARCLEDRQRRVLFYPAIGRFKVGQAFDLEIALLDQNLLMPMKARVVAVRARPQGPASPRGVYLEIVEADLPRFERLCACADGAWAPAARRRHPRLRSEIAARYYLPPHLHRATTLDLSQEGLFLRTDGPIPDVGKGVYLRLFPARWWFPIGLSARVCWIDWVDSRRGMGLHCFEPPAGLRRLARLSARLRRRVVVK